MRIRAIISSILLSIVLSATVADSALSGEPVIDFDTQIVPVLTRAGCNRGSCHGAAIGRGGFKLSLYGGDPAADYTAIVHELEGRRVNLAHADRSLVLRKPLNEIEHEGGMRLELDTPMTDRLRTWLAQGAPRVQSRALSELTITPQAKLLSDVDTVVPLRAMARFSNGETEDVTHLTVFTAEDPAAVSIDLEQGTACVRRRGRHVVIARYLDRVVPLEFLVSFADAADTDADEAPAEATSDTLLISDTPLIDDAIHRRLRTLRIPISSPATDAAFLRRVTLDLTGRLPTPDAIRQFAPADSDPTSQRGQRNSATRRAALVDRLLQSPEFVDYWTYRLAALLRIRTQGQDATGAHVFRDWLREQLVNGTPFDELARTLLTASGDTHESGPPNFYRGTGSARDQAEYVSELFLGVRLRCANCHNHPLDRWTQDDYHGLAALFAKLDRGRIVRVISRGEVTHPATGLPAVPRIPGDRDLPPDVDGRRALAEWLTEPENPYFARAIVNRLWQAMFGRGLIDPVDDIRATNPATHPQLLDALSADFIDHGYDLRRTLRLIATSATYARSATPLPGNAGDQTFYSHALIRPLPAEVLADAYADATGVAEQYGDLPLGTRAIALLDTNLQSRTLDVLGRCSREESCESSAPATDRLSRMLYTINGNLLNPRLVAPDGRLQTWLQRKLTDQQLIEAAYLQTLSRFPDAREQKFWAGELEQARDDTTRRELAEDLFWSLLTCREFTSNH